MRVPTPDAIMQLGFGFCGSKALLTAIELEVFSHLAQGAMEENALRVKVGIHERSARDFFDALVALGMLAREGGKYANSPETDLYLDKAKPSYIGGILEMANARLYPFWGNLTEGLKTGEPQNDASVFTELYSDPVRLRQFLAGMTGISMGAAHAIAAKFPWADYKVFVDIGGAQGVVPVTVAKAHAHLTGGNFDLPAVGPIFDEYVASFGLSSRLTFHPGNFFHDALPPADVYVMGHILHDWNLAEKKMLLAKAFAALPEGGALIVYEALIDDERRQNATGLLMSLNMLIETPGGFDYSGADCQEWMREVGFSETRVEHLCGSDAMVVAVK